MQTQDAEDSVVASKLMCDANPVGPNLFGKAVFQTVEMYRLYLPLRE